jgi:hypothetical protein
MRRMAKVLDYWEIVHSEIHPKFTNSGERNICLRASFFGIAPDIP